MNLYRKDCYCGNAYGKFGLASLNNRFCNITCQGNSSEICGGKNANSIYRTTTSCQSKATLQKHTANI